VLVVPASVLVVVVLLLLLVVVPASVLVVVLLVVVPASVLLLVLLLLVVPASVLLRVLGEVDLEVVAPIRLGRVPGGGGVGDQGRHRDDGDDLGIGHRARVAPARRVHRLIGAARRRAGNRERRGGIRQAGPPQIDVRAGEVRIGGVAARRARSGALDEDVARVGGPDGDGTAPRRDGDAAQAEADAGGAQAVQGRRAVHDPGTSMRVREADVTRSGKLAIASNRKIASQPGVTVLNAGRAGPVDHGGRTRWTR